MSQSTDLKQTTPTSTKRKIAEPNAPKKKKSRINATESPQMLFNDWLNQFREMNSKYTNVDLSLHASQNGKPNNFVILFQKPMKSGSKSNVVSIHYNIIPTMLKQMHKLYLDLCVENGIFKPKKEDKLIIDEWELDSPQSKLRKVLAELYAKSMVVRYSDASRENCEGCACEATSQRHNDCIMMSLQDRINILFDVLIEKVNEEDINKMVLDTMREEGNEIKGECISKDILKKDKEWIERVNELIIKSLSY